MERLKSIDDLRRLRQRLELETFAPDRARARVCCGTACVASGSLKVIDGLEQDSRQKGIDMEIIRTGCQGMCQNGPNLKMEPDGYYYQRVRPEQASSLLSYTYLGGTPYRQSLYRENYMSEPIRDMEEMPFFKKQVRIALRNNDKIDPTNIHHYIAVGGYRALEKVLSSMTPDDVLNEVDKANLRGRGGAGFPAGKKWKHSKSAPGGIKFVIANGDEGDPGAFMDRAIMEGDPHSLFEGMMLAAYAIGAEYGFVYVRHEYPLAVKNLRHAIRQAEELGLLGRNILGSKFSFFLDVREGAGAFVCGESTALVASIEGERGFPRPRPPRLSESGGGVWGYPSNLNNIETYACVAPIIEKGADWFRSIGTDASPGTKVFALTGKVKNTGLVEVPMGITLREIIFDMGGGILNNKKFKAVQTGGPSGGCIPDMHLDMSVDFDSLVKVGSMMGSGGMVVMDEDTCMVDVAKYFLQFSQSESCGKCPPCRVGTYQMLRIFERITSGKGQHGDIEKLIELGNLTNKGSLCGLGQGAPNPVLSTIKYFRHEYEEHIYDKHCRANVCSGMGIFYIDQSTCFKCGLCKKACAYDSVKETSSIYLIDQDYCTQCKACYVACPIDAVKMRRPSRVNLQEQIDVPYEDMAPIEAKMETTLKEALAAKPGKIVKCAKGISVADAVKAMRDGNAGAIVVLDNKKAAGILTEKDYIARGASINAEKIEDVMAPSPFALDSKVDIGVALNLMIEKKLGYLPVNEAGEFAGIVSYNDIVSSFLPEMSGVLEEVH